MDTYIGNSGHAFVMVGNATSIHSDFFVDPVSGGLAHFHHHYFLMGLVAQLQKAALLSFLARTAEAVRNWDCQGPSDTRGRFAREIQTVHEDFLHFTHRFWFLDISDQLQAQELFALWRKKLKLVEHFDTVRQRLFDLHEHLQMERSMTETERTTRLSASAFGVAALALLVGALGMNLIPGWELPRECSPWSLWQGECAFQSQWLWAYFTFTVVFIVLLLGIFIPLYRWAIKGPRAKVRSKGKDQRAG